MKFRNLIIASLATGLLIGATACKKDLKNQEAIQDVKFVELSTLGENLKSVLDSLDKTGEKDAYILYFSDDKKFAVMSSEEFVLCSAFANLIVRDDNGLVKPSKETGWELDGTVKGTEETLNAITNLADKLDKNRSFAIFLEREQEDNVNILYRYD